MMQRYGAHVDGGVIGFGVEFLNVNVNAINTTLVENKNDAIGQDRGLTITKMQKILLWGRFSEVRSCDINTFLLDLQKKTVIYLHDTSMHRLVRKGNYSLLLIDAHWQIWLQDKDIEFCHLRVIRPIKYSRKKNSLIL